MASIITMLKGLISAMPDNKHESLMEKLRNTLPSSQLDLLNLKTNRLVIDLSPWGGNEPLKQKVATIRKAIEDAKEIEFIYTDSNGSTTNRRVEPYSLVLKGQSWYLYA